MRIVRALVVTLAVLGVLTAGVVSLVPVGAGGASGTARPLDAQPMMVVEVLSGDTVVLRPELPGSQVAVQGGVISARLLSVNAPNFGIISECYAVEAQGRLAELLPKGSIAWVATDTLEKDDNGRWLMNVWAPDGRFVNVLLAVDGFVRAEEMPPNTALWKPVERAGSSAAARFGGLWGECR